MKSILIIVAICFCGSWGYTQSPLDPLKFNSIENQWEWLFVDSSRIETQLSDGTYNLGMHAVLTSEENMAYVVFRDRADRYSGTYIEKIDLSNGQAVWRSKFDHRQTGFHELASWFGIGEDGNLELAFYKNVTSPGILGWFTGQFGLRTLDANTGAELSLDYNINYTEEELMFIFGTTRILKSNSGVFNYFRPEFSHETHSFIYHFKKFNRDANLLSYDSVILSNNNYDYDLSTINPIGSDFATRRFTGPNLLELDDQRNVNPDDFEVILDLFSQDFNTLDSINITDQLPRKWNSRIYGTYGDLMMIQSLDSAYLDLYGINPYVNYSVFDQNGTYLSDIDFGQPVSRSYICPARIRNTSKFIFFHLLNLQSPQKLVNVWLHDTDGETTLLKTLELEDERNIRFMHIEVLENDDVVLLYQAQTNEGDNDVSVGYHNAAIRITSEDLDLSSSTTEVQAEVYDVQFHPNPFRNSIIANFSQPLNGTYTLFDLNGRRLMDGKLHGQPELQLDGSALPAGTYILSIHSKDKVWAGKVIKME